MAEARFMSHVEPAHPTLVKLHDDLVSIYTHIKEHFQQSIDDAFDRVARQIGFVVTNTIPVVLQLPERGGMPSVAMGAENLRGTLFEKELAVALNPQPLPPGAAQWKVAPGNYQIYLLWRGALNLRLRTEWMEPAHVGVTLERFSARRPLPYPQEPAHWFDALALLAPEEVVLIQAIDQVYPELKLADRITATRSAVRQIGPGVREPAHFRAGIREPAHFFRAGIREPAHLAQIDRAALSERAVDILSQVAEMLRQAGF